MSYLLEDFLFNNKRQPIWIDIVDVSIEMESSACWTRVEHDREETTRRILKSSISRTNQLEKYSSLFHNLKEQSVLQIPSNWDKVCCQNTLENVT